MGAFNLDQTFIKGYERSFNQVFQQQESMLKITVRNEPQASEKQRFTFIEPTSGVVDRARQSDSPNIPTSHKMRWSSLHSWTWSELVDDLDVIKTLNDPSSEYLKNAVNAENRWEDELILANIYEAVYYGKEGTSSLEWYDVAESVGLNGDGTRTTAGSIFSASTETGLTLAKIATIGVIMGNNSVPLQDRHIVVNEDQKWSLLTNTRVTNRDYVGVVTALVNGEIPGNYFMGFHFHFLPTDRFVTDTTDTGCIRCAAYHRGSVLRTYSGGLKTRIAEEAGKNFNIRVWAEAVAGGCRLQGKGVVPFLLDPDPAITFS